MADTARDDGARYLAALHAVQTGVACEMEIPAFAGQVAPKHLRVGINGAMCDHAALVRLLVDKGILTHEDYLAAIADELEREKERYEQRLSQHFGKSITLG